LFYLKQSSDFDLTGKSFPKPNPTAVHVRMRRNWPCIQSTRWKCKADQGRQQDGW